MTAADRAEFLVEATHRVLAGLGAIKGGRPSEWDSASEMERRVFRRAALMALTGEEDPSADVREVCTPYFRAVVQGIECALDAAHVREFGYERPT